MRGPVANAVCNEVSAWSYGALLQLLLGRRQHSAALLLQLEHIYIAMV
ncbi:MAG: hypothetical protein ABI612_04295 [Betaproteobacteria bacterium]